jgi:hypothetical protein
MMFTAGHLRDMQMAGEERMPTPGQLVQTMAEVLGVPAATVAQYDRVLAENGLRSKGGRGLSAARVTAGDAANLLIAILGSPISGAAIKDAAHTCRVYGTLPNLERAALRPNLRSSGLASLAELPVKHSLRAALSALIQQAIGATGIPADGPFGESYTGADHLLAIRLDTPRPWAEIFVDSGAGGDPAKWGRLVYTAYFRERLSTKTSPRSLADLHQTRQVTFRTIRLLAATLRGTE